MAEVSTWEKVTATFTAVGGVGAALGALASWRAARKSADAAGDARDALSVSLKPHVRAICAQDGQGGPVVARAVVVGPGPWGYGGVWPAADVLVQFTLASGKQGSASMPVLEPNSDLYVREPPYVSVVVGHPDENWPPPEGDHVQVTVLFSDIRKAASYRVSIAGDLHRSADPASVSFRVTEPQTEQITP